ncbi:MFS transporter [Desulfosporosinus sp. PR]|uniref:MFS transporter n=1 Tax=Candidatus Desulfosporosinus nitrosoreducens TaxID=3401928 RepID=UPI0027EF31A9|nr:MFS transporter [Desulfosporosinus sp. PR]MDQ7092995.1 MFS transporter [Desulfosporosinus sp. PR]
MFSWKTWLSPYRGMPKEIYVIFAARIINALGCFVMPLLTIILTQNIGLSKQMTGLYISISGLLNVPSALIGGKLADTIGRKKVIMLFDGLAIAFYLAAGLLRPSLLMAYILMLAGACMVTAGPAHDALIADLTTAQTRNGAYALSYMGWNIGFAIGPIMGGILYRNHLPLLFIGDALTALVALVLIARFIPETLWKTKITVTAPSRLEKGEKGSIMAVLLKRPILLYFSVIMMGYNFAYAQWAFMLPMQTIQDFPGFGAEYFGYIAAFNGFVVMLFTPIVLKITEGISNMRRMVCGGIFYALGFGMLGIFHALALIFLCAFVYTLGEIILAISVTPFVVSHTPISHRGRMNSLIPMIFRLGDTLGPVVMGYILTYISIESGWRLIGISALFFTVLMFGLEKWEGRQHIQVSKDARV